MTMKKVAVIGATGRLGRLAVQQLVDRGVECKILSRKPVNTADAPKELTADATSPQVAAYLASLPGVSVVEGDVSNTASLKTLVSDCQACLALYGATRKSKISDLWSHPEDSDPSHSKQVNYQGVKNLIDACAGTSCKRIVRITGKGEDPTGIFSILINLLGSFAKAWNYQGELALREQSAVDYTIIRPGIMSEEGPTGKVLTLADDGADLPVAKIRYADIASLSIDCLEADNAARATLTAMTTTDEESASSSWKPLLAKVQADRRKYPEDMLDQHYAAVRKALIKFSGVSVVLLAILIKLIF